jgi:thiosulfate/3-mercaptopyruvate sulfurtransferase
VDRLASIDEVAGGGSLVIDVRAPERYRGEVEPVDRRAGHIPGAVNRPTTANLDPATGRFRSPDELAARFAGTEGAIVHCGSGVNACHTLLAMERAGVGGARLYAGSWSQWSSDPDRPVATG